MERQPMTKQRSPWLPAEDESGIGQALLAAGASSCDLFWRNVHDGQLRVIVSNEPSGWHLSISHAKRARGGEMVPGRYPTWDEIADARYELLPTDLNFAMFLPPPEDYTAIHATTFHLWEVRP